MIKRIFDILEHQLTVFRKEISLAYKVDGQWKTFSSADFKEQADLMSFGLLALGKKNPDSGKLQQLKDAVSHADVATVLYTSGTTGIPKGVMLTHDNIISNIAATEHLAPVNQEHRALSFLPLCHSYERMLTYLYMYLGVSIYYAESMEKIADNLKEIKPQVFSTVPRLLEKVYDRILERGKALTGVKKLLFLWAVNLGLRYELNGVNGWWYETQLKLANTTIFDKWREALV